MIKLRAIVPATIRKKPPRLIVTFVELPKLTNAAPKKMPMVLIVDSKQKHLASLRGPFAAKYAARSRMAVSRTRLCRSNNPETPSTICQSGVGEGKYGHATSVIGAMKPIISISIRSALVIIFWFFNDSTMPKGERNLKAFGRRDNAPTASAPPELCRSRAWNLTFFFVNAPTGEPFRPKSCKENGRATTYAYEAFPFWIIQRGRFDFSSYRLSSRGTRSLKCHTN